MTLPRDEEVKTSSTLSDGMNARDQVETAILKTVQSIADASIPRISQVADLALQINRTVEVCVPMYVEFMTGKDVMCRNKTRIMTISGNSRPTRGI